MKLSALVAQYVAYKQSMLMRRPTAYKTRLVPMSPALTGAVGEYVAQRAKEHPTQPIPRKTSSAGCAFAQAWCALTEVVTSRDFMI
jgi:hypothetical protein